MKTLIAKRWLFSLSTCILVILTLISCIFPQRQNEINGTEQCLNVGEDGDERRLYCFRDIVVNKSQRNREREKAFSKLIESWSHRDGSAAFVLSDIFLDILVSDYAFFFSQMKDHPNAYNAWLPEVGDLSFVGLEYFALENRRQKLISLLEDITDLNQDVDPLRERLLDALRGVKPQQID